MVSCAGAAPPGNSGSTKRVVMNSGDPSHQATAAAAAITTSASTDKIGWARHQRRDNGEVWLGGAVVVIAQLLLPLLP